MTLSSEEQTVLLIAAAGEPLMPIGRWKPAVESLVAKGFMKPHPHPGDPTGYFNHRITAAGAAVANQAEQETDDLLGEILTRSSQIGYEQKKARAQAEQIAVQLVDLAELSSQVTGETKIETLRRWSEIILTRALEMLQK
jgi:hypothetical protein